jgi:hypothetical protein
MANGERGSFLAEIDVCTDRKIVRNILIKSRGMTAHQAKEKALEEFRKLKENGRYAVLQPVEGITESEKVQYARKRSVPVNETRRHEGFHRSAAKFRNGSASWPVDESAAYAYESTVKPRNEKEEHHIASRIRIYSRLARHSVRLLFALSLAEPNGLLQSSMAGLKRESTAIAGDARAVALNYAKDYVLYLECLEIIKEWGRKDAKKIFMEAMEVASERGFHEARQFLLRQLPEDRKEDIDERYGINLNGFRFSSPYASSVVHEEWVW